MYHYYGRGKYALAVGTFVVALAIRLAFVNQVHLTPYGDALEYDRIATHLLNGQGFAMREGSPTAFRPPLYPFFVLTVYAATHPGNHRLVQQIQAIISALICVLVVLLTRRVFGEEAAWASAVLAAISPELILYCGVLLSEMGSFFWLVVATLASLSAERWSAWVGGMSFAAGALTRPATVLFVPGVVWWKWKYDREPSRRRWLMAFALAMCLGMSPWIVRNYVVFKAFVPLTTHGGYDLWFANRPGSWGGASIGYEDDPVLSFRGGEVERDRFAASLFLQTVRADPVRYLKLCVYRLSLALSPERDEVIHRVVGVSSPEINAAFQRSGAGAVRHRYQVPGTFLGDVYPAIFFMGLIVAAVIGVGCVVGESNRGFTLLLSMVATYLFITCFTVQEVRYRAAVVPLVIPLASFGIVRIREGLRRLTVDPRRRRALLIAAGVAALLCANFASHFLDIDLPGRI